MKYLVEGGEVRTYQYKSSSDLRKKIYNTVKNLLAQDIEPGEIVILSPKKLKNSFLNGENIFSDLCPFVNLADDLSKYDDQTHLKFSTAHSFKGLESRILILAEVEKIKGDYARLLNYTAISRARVKLYFFYSEDIAKCIESLN